MCAPETSDNGSISRQQATMKQAKSIAAYVAFDTKHFHRIIHTGMGTLSLASSLFSILMPENLLLVITSVLTSSVVAVHSSMVLQEQAPLQTTICKSPFLTVAPHREAFQRTSIILLYVNARIIQEMAKTALPDWQQTTFSLVTIMAIRMFLPWKPLDLSNGNTFCFVIPMMLGVFGDYCMQYLVGNATYDTMTAAIPSSHRWVSMQELLAVQSSGLVIAFLFTLSFRKYIPIQKLYFVSAGAVNFMVVLGLHQAKRLIGDIYMANS